MRKRNRIFIALIFFCLPSFSNGQAKDSLVLTFSDFMELVMRTHPLARQADLLDEQSRFQLMMAKGQFDPQLGLNYDNKFYSGKNYYSLLHTMASIPTWFGPELKLGFDQTQGAFLNEQELTPENGLLYAGVKVPLAQGILIDQRRAAVKQARLFVAANEQQRLLILNDLFYSAAKIYYEWMLCRQNVLVYRNGVELASKRLAFVRALRDVGERTAIDTLEASIQLQSRQMDLNEAELQFKNTGLLLSVYLWTEDNQPMELRREVMPAGPDARLMPVVSRDTLSSDMSTLSAVHPALKMYEYKLKDLEIEQRLKRDKFKPKINAQYNFLGVETGSGDIPSFSMQNYKWGLQFDFPVFLRQERGAVGLTKIKIEQTRLDQNLKSAEIRAKLISAYNEMEFCAVQMDISLTTFLNYQQLLEAERFKFSQGESTLFMVNAREVKVIESEVKYNETRMKYLKSLAAYQYALGEGHLNAN